MTEDQIQENFQPGDWAWSAEHKQPVRIVGSDSVWGRYWTTILVPGGTDVVRTTPANLESLTSRAWTDTELRARALVLSAIEAMNRPQATAVNTANIVPLPHQIAVVERALENPNLRLLLADEVGLGKTIEAGLILKELKNRALVRRTVVVAPKSMQIQWVSEMKHRFGEEFVRIGAGGVPFDAGVNPWEAFAQVVCSIDSVKPITNRAGWNQERLDAHNRTRFEAITDANWDLVIIDEAHHAAGSEDDIARHELAKTLCASASRVLLLSATPHSGKTEAFTRLMSLLDRDFLHGKPINNMTVQPLVVRTEKRNATSSDGKPLFLPRTTNLERVSYGSRAVERQLYDAVTDYVRNRYQMAIDEKNYAAGFLTLLMQRLVSSSTAAILTTLEKRQLALTEMGEQLQLFPGGAEDWGDLSGEDQVDAFTNAQQAAWGNELREVELLVDVAKKVSASGPDAKTIHLLGLIQRVRREVGIPSLKLIVFTEFRETQEMLIRALNSAGISTSRINGSMSINAREFAQREFENKTEILISTDAGGEGINLQFASVVVNYDMPWNPMKVEQRIGRVDRIGQERPVKAFNLVNEHSVDDRVLAVLERKLAIILKEIGIDKRSDILETASQDIENLYTKALLDPDQIDQLANDFEDSAGRAAKEGHSIDELLGSSRPASKYNNSSGLLLESALVAWHDWSGIKVDSVGEIVDKLPVTVSGEPIPTITGLDQGVLTVWELTIGDSHRVFSVFRSDDLSIRPSSARITLDTVCKFEGSIETISISKAEWDELFELGNMYIPQPQSGDELSMAPSLDLRLVVRVES